MSVQDPRLVDSLFDSFFSMSNPVGDEDGDLELRLNEFLYQVQGNQVDVDSLDEDAWREKLEAHGFDEDEVVDALQMIAAWGVIDDA